MIKNNNTLFIDLKLVKSNNRSHWNRFETFLSLSAFKILSHFLFFYFYLFIFYLLLLKFGTVNFNSFPLFQQQENTFNFKINCRPVILIKVYHNNKVFFSNARSYKFVCTSCSSIVDSKNTILYPSHISARISKKSANELHLSHFVRFLSYEN